jgi:monooxygenase
MHKTETTVIIVGAGLAGICASYYLSKNDIPYLILEKSSAAGGIWSSLTWPGIRCDTEILNYSYSFNPFLSDSSLVSGGEISDYLKTTADDFGITEKTLFDTRVKSANFSTTEQRWNIQTSRGEFQTRFLLNANGYFSDKPHVPKFKGSENFNGEITHLFKVTRNTDIRGKSIVLVGSGASAISTAPALAAECSSLTLLQRTPSYIYEDNNRPGWILNMAQKLHAAGFHLPVKTVNFFLQLKYDLVFVVFRKAPWIGKLFFRHHWKGSVDRETYDQHFCPDYNPWEQRIPVAVGLRQLIENREIDLVTGRIREFRESGILLEDGRFIESNLCILATGFNLSFFRFAISIDRQPIEPRGINFYKGMMMGGIPNYFQPFGPPHTSFTRRIETVSKHIVKIMLYMRKHQLDTVSIARKQIEKVPRITPNYIMRNLDALPAFYGTLELPTIDNLFFYRFRARDYHFSGGAPWANQTTRISPVRSA